jgi:hypothetical protein
MRQAEQVHADGKGRYSLPRSNGYSEIYFPPEEIAAR